MFFESCSKQFSNLHKNWIFSYFSVFCLSQLLWNALKYIFDLLNDRTRRIKIYQNQHWKKYFSLLMTQLFMFDQTRASQSWDLLRPSRPAVVYNCVTQLMLYTGDKLSSPIFCCLWVSQASVSPVQISTFSNIYRHTSPLLTMYHLISNSTNLYWPSTSQYRHILTQYHL